MQLLAPLIATLSEPNYRLYTLGNSVSLVGTWVQRVAVGWLAWDLTGSATWLGVVAAADLLPAVLLGPFGGAVADRGSEPRRGLARAWRRSASGGLPRGTGLGERPCLPRRACRRPAAHG